MSTDTRRFQPLSLGSATDQREQQQAARALGFAEGWSSGRRAAAAQAHAAQEQMARRQQAAEAAIRADLDTALAALAMASRHLMSQTAPLIEEVGQTVLEAAITLAEAILDGELRTMTDPARQALRRALAPLPTAIPVTVRLNPDDHRALVHDGTDPESMQGYHLRLVEDETLTRGEAIAEQAGSVVDARIGAALGRALDVVRSAQWST